MLECSRLRHTLGGSKLYKNIHIICEVFKLITFEKGEGTAGRAEVNAAASLQNKDVVELLEDLLTSLPQVIRNKIQIDAFKAFQFI
jgi:hypothetical protein